MRYTEEKQEKKLEDLFDVVIFFITSVVVAPYRLVSEISKKMMYLPYRSIEKMMLTSILIVTGFIVVDVIIFLFTGRINLIDGSVPLVVKVIVLLLIATIALQFLGKRKVFSETAVVESVTENSIHEIKMTEIEESEIVRPVESLDPVLEIQEESIYDEEDGAPEYEELDYRGFMIEEPKTEVIDLTMDTLEVHTQEDPPFDFYTGIEEAQESLNFNRRSEADLDVPSISEEQRLLLMERIRKVREGGLL